jgi:hypothetical protein
LNSSQTSASELAVTQPRTNTLCISNVTVSLQHSPYSNIRKFFCQDRRRTALAAFPQAATFPNRSRAMTSPSTG